jgi:hypothetical protein
MIENNRLSFILWSVLAVMCIGLIVAKLHSPFWFHQPVYHMYEIYPRISWSRAPYLKRTRPPKQGIFCNLNQVRTEKNERIQLQPFVDLLQGHYLDNDTNLYHHTLNTMKQIMYDYPSSSYISGFFETEREEPTFHTRLNTNVVYGMITSRPTGIYFLYFPAQNRTIHYFDFICVHEKYSSKSISRNLIQTHIYNHSIQDPTFTGAYLFKKEIDLCKGVVPLVQSSTYTFMLTETPLARLPPNYSIKCLNHKSSIDVWRVLYEQMKTQFDICVLPDFPVTLDWLTNERYIIYISVYKDKKQERIHGLYIFEDTYVSYEQDIPCPFMLRLAGSMVFNDVPRTHDLYFFRGFLHSLHAIKLDKKKFGVLEIPNVSDNDMLLERWRERYELRNETVLGYYLYNMVYPNMPILPNRLFVLT